MRQWMAHPKILSSCSSWRLRLAAGLGGDFGGEFDWRFIIKEM